MPALTSYTRKAQTSTIPQSGLPQPQISYGEVCASSAYFIGYLVLALSLACGSSTEE